MSTRVQWRRGNTAQTAVFTGAQGEITVNTDTNVVVVHDGVSAGGFPAPTLTFSQGGFDRANDASSLAQAAYNAANAAGSSAMVTSAYNHANGAFDKANSANVLAQAAFDSGNNTLTFAQSGYDKANTSGIVAQAAFDKANADNSFTQSAFDKANTAYTNAGDAYNYTTSVDTKASAAFNKANSANVLAQSAYDSSNTKFSSSGGTISGSVNITGQANVSQRLSVGTGAYTILPNLITQFTGTSDWYSQINQQNLSGKGSGDVVVTADNGTDQINFIDMGIAGSVYDDTTPNAYPTTKPNDAYLYLVGDPSSSYGGNLVIGTAGSSNFADISIVQGTGYAETARFVLGQGLVVKTGTASVSNTSGALVVQGGVGITGDIYAGHVYDNGIELKTYTDTANTFLQSNDALTLAASKSYTDSANTKLKSYVDGQIVVVQNEIASNLTTAESYTDTANTYNRTYTNNANTAMKSYVDGQVVTVNNNISANLVTAKSYTDTANTYNQNYTNSANTALKSYVDGQVIVVQNEIASNLATAEAYTDTANTYNRNYTNNANTALKSYVDGQVIVVQNEIASNLATAEAYTDTANAYNRTYTNNANTAMKSYVDGQVIVVQNEIASNLATAKAYTDTANTYNTNYTNTANTSLKSYVDGQVVTVNNNISANLTTSKAYTDTANTFNQSYTNNANTALKSYVDGQVVTVNNNISANLTTAKAYTDTANTFLQANDTITLSSAKSYTDSANTKLKSYVDGKYLPLAGGTITGDVNITSTTGSSSYGSGALVVSGGVGVGQNLNVYGNTIISGSLTVNGPQVITSSSVVAYNNPYIILHEPTSGYIVSDDGADIGVDFEYYSPTGIAPRVITSGSADGANATVYITDGSYVKPGNLVTISGVTPSNFNGTYSVTTSSPGQFTYALAYTGTIDTSGTLGKYSRVLNVSITSGSTVSGSKISTINISPSVTLTVGQTVTIFGVTPTGYNGTWTVLTASAGSFTFQNTSNLGNISVNGTVVLDNRRGFFGRSDDSGDFEFYRTGTWTAANTFAGLYGTVKAGQFDAAPNDSSTTADIQAGFFALPSKKIIDSTSVTNDQHGQVASANLGIITIASASANVNYSGAATLRILGAPVAGNNVSLGSNLYSLQVDSGISYFGGGINVNSQGITFSDGTTQKTNAASFAYSTSAYTQANTNTTAIATANTFLQANDATTLASAKSYTDTANTFNQSYTNTANTALKSYVDGQVVTVNNNISANLTTAKSYTDTANTYNQTYTNTANTALKSYVDGQVVTVNNNISANLATAKTYTDTANTFNQTYTNSANTALKSYVDGQVVTLNNNITANLATAKAYTDTANTYNKGYTDSANTVIQGQITYITGVDNAQNTTITSAFSQANSAYTKANGAVQTAFVTVSANGTSITPSSNTDTLTLTAATANGINILNPSSKTIDFGLRTTGVVAGGYGNTTSIPSITVDTFGRITSVSNNVIYVPPGTSIVANTGQLTANASTGIVALGLATTAVSAGNYGGSTQIPVLAIDAYGRITSASNTSVSTTISLAGGSGSGSVSGGGTLTFTGSTGLTTSVSGSTVTLTNTGVTSLTSNSSARITQSVTTGAVAFDLATTAVTAGTYNYSTIQVDAYGRITTASSGTPVTTFNTRSGAVTLTSSDVTTALTYTPANVAGDQFTGAVTATSLKSNTSVTVNTSAFYTSTAYTTSSVSQVTVDSFPTATYRSAKYEVQMTSGTSYHVIELRVVHDGTNPLLAQYGEIFTGSSLGTFDVSITTGNLNLLFTPTNSATTVKLIRTNIVV